MVHCLCRLSQGRGVTVFPLLSRLNAYHNSNFCEEICFRNLTDNNATNNVVTVKMQLPTIVDDYFPSDETSGASGTSTPGTPLSCTYMLMD